MNIALIGGAGEGLGAALGRRFAQGGLEVVLCSRSQGERADLRDEAEVIALFERVEKRAPIAVAIFNAGANFRASILDTPADMFEKVWRLGCYAGFLFGREAARRMLARGRGTILFTGATASVRGAAQFAAFAAAKGGLRQVAQAMARELGPKNIHVAHLVIDSGVDTAWVRERIKAREGAEALANLDPGRLMRPEAVAESYWALYQQPRDAWSSEMEIRPFGEKW
jgi:NAD(P)-dependent dehydrogenase (short-subunit alcohol dehydrogenase family)